MAYDKPSNSKLYIHGSEDMLSEAPACAEDMYDAKGEKNLKDPGKAGPKYENDNDNTGKME